MLSVCLGSEENGPLGCALPQLRYRSARSVLRFEAAASKEKLFESSVSLGADEPTTAKEALPRSDSRVRLHDSVDADAENKREPQVGSDRIEILVMTVEGTPD